MKPGAARLGLIVALLLGTGAHWVLLQCAAWASMTWRQSSTLPLAAAIERTFDGRHPCGLCHVVERGTQSSERQAPRGATLRLDWFADAAIATADAPPMTQVPETPLLRATWRAEPPRLMPPRAALS